MISLLTFVYATQMRAMAASAGAAGVNEAMVAAAGPTIAKPFFKNGTETFSIRDASGKVPVFHLLSESASDRALALAVVTTLNLQPQTVPKLPLSDYIDAKLEEMKFSPQAGADKDALVLTVRISGHDLDLPKKVSRAKFLAGEWIDLQFPSEERTVAIYDVRSRGRLKFKLAPVSGDITITEATGHVDYSSSFAGGGEQTIRFAGRAIRKF